MFVSGKVSEHHLEAWWALIDGRLYVNSWGWYFNFNKWFAFCSCFFLHSQYLFGISKWWKGLFFRHQLLSTAATWHSSRLLVPTGSYDLPSGPGVQGLIENCSHEKPRMAVCVFFSCFCRWKMPFMCTWRQMEQLLYLNNVHIYI